MVALVKWLSFRIQNASTLSLHQGFEFQGSDQALNFTRNVIEVHITVVLCLMLEVPGREERLSGICKTQAASDIDDAIIPVHQQSQTLLM